MNLPDWVSISNLGTVSNNDSNTTFPQQKPKQPRFPHAFLPEHCATTLRMLAAARAHSLLTSITPPPPTHPPCLTSPLQPYITAPSTDTAHTLLLPRHATLRHRPPTPTPASTRLLQPHHHHRRRRLQKLRPTPRPRCAVLCLAQKALANTAIPTCLVLLCCWPRDAACAPPAVHRECEDGALDEHRRRH